MFGQINTIHTGTVPIFNNLEFKYIIHNPIINNKKLNRPPTYILVDNDKLKPLEIEQSFKYKLEQSIKNYINDNISKLFILTDEYTEILGFDYKAVPERINDIKQIDSVEIVYSNINNSNTDIPVLELNINVMYIKLNNEITQLLPKQVKPITYDIILEKNISLV